MSNSYVYGAGALRSDLKTGDINNYQIIFQGRGDFYSLFSLNNEPELAKPDKLSTP